MLAGIILVLCSYGHFSRGILLAWCDGDALHMQRAETMMAMLLFDTEADQSHLLPFFELGKGACTLSLLHCRMSNNDSPSKFRVVSCIS